jgi:hypothetical protein
MSKNCHNELFLFDEKGMHEGIGALGQRVPERVEKAQEK